MAGALPHLPESDSTVQRYAESTRSSAIGRRPMCFHGEELIERRPSIMHDKRIAAADSTAVRVALWRALHVQVDPPPHVLEDEIGLRLAAPDDGWRHRPDMDPHGTRLFR